jgi:hypothetical protein
MHHFSRRLAASALTIVFAVQLGGCASLPHPVAERTGEPLSVREKTETALVTEKVKVGEVEHKDSSGRTVATSQVYANQTRQVQYQTWSAYQGEQTISDDDLYRIANDKAAEDEVKSSRENGVTMEYIGLAILAVGVGGVVGGYVLNANQNPESPSPAGLYLISGSGLVAAGGGLLTYLGARKVKAEHPLDQSRAQNAAIRYNHVLGSGPRVTSTTGATPGR